MIGCLPASTRVDSCEVPHLCFFPYVVTGCLPSSTRVESRGWRWAVVGPRCIERRIQMTKRRKQEEGGVGAAYHEAAKARMQQVCWALGLVYLLLAQLQFPECNILKTWNWVSAIMFLGNHSPTVQLDVLHIKKSHPPTICFDLISTQGLNSAPNLVISYWQKQFCSHGNEIAGRPVCCSIVLAGAGHDAVALSSSITACATGQPKPVA